MNYLLRSLSVTVALAASMTAFATERETTTAPTASSPATPAAQPTAAPTVNATDAAKNEPPKVPPGYKVKVIDGETRFCRKEVPLGSRFPTEVCMTQAQYEEQERNRDSMRNGLQDRQKSYKINQ